MKQYLSPIITVISYDDMTEEEREFYDSKVNTVSPPLTARKVIQNGLQKNE